ncbi:hypothetical protein A9Q99_10500 [Gammaproteobacteria bacterium 45_16_T64]|nr:hypothetical protein A9Q99_10500 [Gammaproteobacteria bacterium 45_16_T64]
MNQHTITRLTLLSMLSASLMACGSSGGSSSTPAASTSTPTNTFTPVSSMIDATTGETVLNAKSHASCIKAPTIEGPDNADIPEDNACILVRGNSAIVYGVLGTTTPALIETLHRNHPAVTTLILQNVPGSENDEKALEADKLVRKYRLSTHVPNDGHVASGGTDMFTSGLTRSIDVGARVGVHSWAESDDQGNSIAGSTYPETSPKHQPYLDFYTLMKIPVDFYWFTMKAAPADGMHYMSVAEMQQYQLLTSNPQTRTLASNFNGTYRLRNTSGVTNVNLHGNNHANLIGDENNNILKGNSGVNTLDGMNGIDTALFRGPRTEYIIDATHYGIITQDSIDDRDGINTLIDIEYLQFSDQRVDVSDL